MENGNKLMEKARAALALHPKCGAKRKQRDGFCVNPAMRTEGATSMGAPQLGLSLSTASPQRRLRRKDGQFVS